MNLDRPRPSSAPLRRTDARDPGRPGPSPTPATAGTAASRQPAGDGPHSEGNPDDHISIRPWRHRGTGVVTMIAVVGFGLVALAVLALVVGLVDAAQAGQWRWVARDRRAAWEQRRREERLALTRDRFPKY